MNAIINLLAVYLQEISSIMLQVSVLRAAPEMVKERLAKKNFSNLALVDTIVQLDDERKRVQAAFDDTQSKVNAASKEIGMMMGKEIKQEPNLLNCKLPIGSRPSNH